MYQATSQQMSSRFILIAAILAGGLLGCGCSGGDVGDSSQSTNPRQPHSSAELQARLDGVTFVSTKKYETGLGENGAVFGYWRVAFSAGTATWDYSDTRESGRFAIGDDGKISADIGPGGVTGRYDPGTGELLWDGKRYEAVAESDESPTF
jgi:hypothetical protein